MVSPEMSTPTAQPACIRGAASDAGVAWLTLDNGPKLNAMSPPMWRTLGEALARFEHDPAVRCVVLTGQGERAFCVGADLSQFDAIRADALASDDYDRLTSTTIQQLQSFPKPTIAVISGFCPGAGVAISAACDLRIAAVGSRVSIPTAKLGIGYPYHSVKRLTDLVGPAQCLRLLYTAERFSAEEMLRIGFFDELLEADELAPRARALVDGIAANAPLTVAAAKYAVQAVLSDDSNRDIAGCAERVRACNNSADHQEGRQAFAESARPAFAAADAACPNHQERRRNCHAVARRREGARPHPPPIGALLHDAAGGLRRRCVEDREAGRG